MWDEQGKVFFLGGGECQVLVESGWGRGGRGSVGEGVLGQYIVLLWLGVVLFPASVGLNMRGGVSLVIEGLATLAGVQTKRVRVCGFTLKRRVTYIKGGIKTLLSYACWCVCSVCYYLFHGSRGGRRWGRAPLFPPPSPSSLGNIPGAQVQ